MSIIDIPTDVLTKKLSCMESDARASFMEKLISVQNKYSCPSCKTFELKKIKSGYVTCPCKLLGNVCFKPQECQLSDYVD